MSLSTIGNSSASYYGNSAMLPWATQSSPHIESSHAVIDYSIPGNRLHQHEDGSIGITSKTLATVLGEQAQPLVNTICHLSSRAFQGLQSSFSLLDKTLSKILIFPPVVEATSSNDQKELKDNVVISNGDPTNTKPETQLPTNDALSVAINEAKNYEWVHKPDSENPTQGHSIKVFRIVSGPPLYVEGRIFQQELVHYDPKKYSHVLTQYSPIKWHHEDAKRLSFQIGQVTLFDPEQNLNLIVNTNMKILSSIQFHSEKQSLTKRDFVVWRKEEHCLQPYQKFDTQSFWERPDETIYDISIRPMGYDFRINEIHHVSFNAYLDYSHQVVKLALNDPSSGYTLIQESYEIKHIMHPHLIKHQLIKNNDSTRSCIRRITKFIRNDGKCPFFGTYEKEFIVSETDISGFYIYRGEKDISWGIPFFKNIQQYYSRCKAEPNTFETQELEYNVILPHDKHRPKTEL